jgi:hypothetical protein
MAIMEGIDLEIQSWFVDASEIEFCRRPDGSDWLLGEGSYGKVRGSGCMVCAAACLLLAFVLCCVPTNLTRSCPPTLLGSAH